MHKFYFNPDSYLEVDKASLHYEGKRRGLGDEFEDDFFNTVDFIRESPEIYEIYVKPDVRRVSLRVFPYYILYRTNHDSIEILAIGYKGKDDSYWLERAN